MQGITSKDDSIPMTPEMRDSPRGREEERKHWEMMRYYYRIHGYDEETGIPTRAKLEEMNVKEIADRMYEGMPYEPWQGPKLRPLH